MHTPSSWAAYFPAAHTTQLACRAFNDFRRKISVADYSGFDAVFKGAAADDDDDGDADGEEYEYYSYEYVDTYRNTHYLVINIQYVVLVIQCITYSYCTVYVIDS